MDIDVHELTVDRDDDACAIARSWVATLAPGLPPNVSARVLLLTHELVTNAFRHSDTERVWVTILSLPDAVRVQVTDEGLEREPAPVDRGLYAESGRGLRWVSSLATFWGVKRRNATGVWFQIDHRPAA